MKTIRESAIEQILKMPPDQLMKVIIFMAGMEAEQEVKKDENA